MHVKPVKHYAPHDAVATLSQLLVKAASSYSGMTFYSLNNSEGIQISYSLLLDSAKEKAKLLHGMGEISPSMIFLLHFNSHLENIEWFWAATLAGSLLAISTPFANDLTQRRKHLVHLQNLLNKPVVLTTTELLPEFLGNHELKVRTVESLRSERGTTQIGHPIENSGDDVAVLMLTSGSTGNAKAVPLQHSQILTSVRSKCAHHGTSKSSTFLNWIGLDHVADLTEIHLHAMSLCANRVHVQSADLLQDPLQFLKLLETHEVEYTFAPNFFLTKLRDCVDANPGFKTDLKNLKALISGGESNVVSTCTADNPASKIWGGERGDTTWFWHDGDLCWFHLFSTMPII